MSNILEVLAKAVADDPVGGCQLIHHVTYSVVASEVAAMEPWLVEKADERALERVLAAKRALGRVYVQKAASGQYPDESALTTAKYLADLEMVFSKSAVDWVTYNNEGKTRRQRVMRDDLGRFTSVASGPKQVTGTNEDSSLTLSPKVRDRVQAVVRPGATSGVYEANRAGDEDRINASQGSYEAAVDQAIKLIDRLDRERVKADEVEVRLFTKGSKAFTTIGLTDLAQGLLPDQMDDLSVITGMQMRPASGASESTRVKFLQARQNRGWLAGLFNSRSDGGAGDSYTPLAQLLAPSGDAGVKSLIGRISVAGEILASVDGPANLVKLTQLMGQYGPEAAEVFSSHAERAAYRYRGTERTPDRALMNQFYHGDVQHLDSVLEAAEESPDGVRNTIRSMVSRGVIDPETKLGSAIEFRVSPKSPSASPYEEPSADQVRLGATSDVTVDELVKTLPRNPTLAQLSFESGHVLPSQGVLFDSDGDLVSQSVGFADDHYLPFNLRSLARLPGGQYVRTRQQGGLTGEDIYASVFHGVRSATVASTSGVFRVEFAPDFRGARSKSDKAFAMYDRYLQLLDAVADSGLYMQDISPEESAQIEMDLLSQYPNLTKAKFKEKLEEEKNKARKRALQVDLEPIKTEASERAAREMGVVGELTTSQLERLSSSRRYKDLYQHHYSELFTQAKEDKVRQLSLNGEGYALALQTLQHQFPYFIRSVEFEPLMDSSDGEGFFAKRGWKSNVAPRPSRSKDKGYVRPGRLRPVPSGQWWKDRNPDRVGTDDGVGGGGSDVAVGGGVRPAAAAAGAVVPATPDTKVAQPAGGEGTLPADTTSPAARTASARNRFDEVSRKKLIDDFAADMKSLRFLNETPRDPVAGSPAAQEWDRIKGMNLERILAEPNKESRAWWLFSNDEEMLPLLVQTHPAAVAQIIDQASNEQIVRALEKEWGDSLDRLIMKYQPFGVSPDATVEDFVNVFRQRVNAVIDSELLAKPFVKPQLNMSDAFLREAPAAIGFQDLVELNTKEKLNAWVAADEVKQKRLASNPVRSRTEIIEPLRDYAERIGTHEGKWLMMRDVSARVELAMGTLDALNGVATAWREETTDSDKEAIRAEFEHRQIGRYAEGLKYLGISRDKALSLVSPHPEFAIRAERERLQRARTLVEVARAVGALDGGGADPKALVPQWRHGEVSKRGSSSQRAVRVVSPRSMVSKVVSARRLAGLPLVHRRR